MQGLEAVSRQDGGQVLGVEAWRAWHTDLGCYGASAPRCAADIAEHPPREVMWSQFFTSSDPPPSPTVSGRGSIASSSLVLVDSVL